MLEVYIYGKLHGVICQETAFFAVTVTELKVLNYVVSYRVNVKKVNLSLLSP